MKNLITMLLVSLFIVGASFAQDVEKPVFEQKQEQAQLEIKDCLDNLPAEVQAKVEEAKKVVAQTKEALGECKTEAEKEALMEQLRTQDQKRIQESLKESGLDEATKERVREAIKDIQQSSTQRQTQLKECK